MERDRIQELKSDGSYVEGPAKPMDHEKNFYPKYDEYELMAGEEKTDRWKDFKNPYFTGDNEDQLTSKKKP